MVLVKLTISLLDFCQYTTRITRRECGRKGRLDNGRIVYNTVGYPEHRKLGL